MRRVLLVPLISLLSFPVVASAAFSDVSASHPNAEAIQYLQENRIIDGYSDTYPRITFKPDNFINRVEFTKIILQARELDENGPGRVNDDTCFSSDMIHPDSPPVSPLPIIFSDVHNDDWFEAYVCLAKKDHIIDGYSDGTFRPANPISFAEAAKIVVKALNAYEDCGGGTPCPLVGDDHPWYEEYVRGLESKHAVPLSIARLDQPITRGEMAEMVWRLKAGVTTKPSRTYEGLASKEEWRHYVNPELGINLDLPLSWPEPVVERNPYSTGGIGTTSPIWRLLLGPLAPNCNPNDECYQYQFTVEGFAANAQSSLISDLQKNAQGKFPEIQILREWTAADGTHILYTEGGMCSYKNLFVVGASSSMRLTWNCGGDSQDSAAIALFDQMLNSLSITK